MKVIKSTGLVPVKALMRFKNHRSGSVFGIEPKLVGAAIKAGEVELVDVPDGIETIELPDPMPAPKKSEPRSEDPIEIPDGWEDQHYAKNVLLAKRILGVEELSKIEGKNSSDIANEIIEAEVARRAAAASAETEGNNPANDAGEQSGQSGADNPENTNPSA